MSHEDTIRAAYDAWNRDDLQGYLGALHPDVEIRPVLGENPGVDVYRRRDGAIRLDGGRQRRVGQLRGDRL
jgi:ketosteroid isomerase-like protein